jgi:YVTN family beta-propeller protein
MRQKLTKFLQLFLVFLLAIVPFFAFTSAATADLAYVGNANYDSVEVVDLNTNTHVTSIPVGNQPIGIVKNEAMHRVYVSNSQDGTISVIDTTINSVIETIPLPGYFLDLAISPDGSRVYAGGWGNGQPVAVIDTATNSVIETLTGFSSPQHMAVSPDGKRLYVVNTNCCPGGPGSLTILDITNNYALIADIPLEREPVWVTVTPHRSKVYVSEPV